MQISTVNRPSTSLNGPVELQQNEHRGHSAPLAPELTFAKHSGPGLELGHRDGHRRCDAYHFAHWLRTSRTARTSLDADSLHTVQTDLMAWRLFPFWQGTTGPVALCSL